MRSQSEESISTSFKIPESELTTRLSKIIKTSISRIQYQGPSRCGLHAGGIVDELSAKHSHISSHSLFSAAAMSDNGGSDFDAIFCNQIFSLILSWVVQAASFTSHPGIRSSKTRLAQRLALPLAPHFARLITFMLSPASGKSRLVPLNIAKEKNKKHGLLFIFNGAEREATQCQLYLQYIRFIL